MPDLEQKNQNDFMVEKIKAKPVNKKKLIRRTLITISMAIIFGLVACVTFLVLEPVISNWLNPDEEPQVEMVVFPEDKEEMSPEDMLAENLPTESPSPTPEPEEESVSEPGEGAEASVVLAEEQIEEILSRVTLDLDSYKELYGAVAGYAESLRRYMVTVMAHTSSEDWLDSVQESKNQCSGVIISENGIELLILTEYSAVMSAERLVLTFYDDSQAEAQLKQYNDATNLAVLSVGLESLSDALRAEGMLPIAQFGSSGERRIVGTPVVAMGSPMGTSHSVGYGVITSSTEIISMTDRNYRLILTDINGSPNANGVLFNLQGQVLGIITNKIDSDTNNLIRAYGITELQRTVEKMSNAATIPYLGIRGGDVPKEANQELGMPFGAYVEEIEMDSPAMQAGIQRGDVITALDDNAVTSFNVYSNLLMQMEPEQVVTVIVMRQAQEEYKEMEFSIELGGVD